MGEDAVAWPLGFVTLDLVLRVILPGALIFFLLGLVAPDLLRAVSSSVVTGLFAFLILGFLSYSFYRALYVAVVCRFVCPQLNAARDAINELTKAKKRWTLVRAIYIGWRETQTADLRLKFVARVSPYVHAGYQSAIIFALFAIYVLATSPSLPTVIMFGLVALLLFSASLREDHELALVEMDCMVGNWSDFYSYLIRTLTPELLGKAQVPSPPRAG